MQNGFDTATTCTQNMLVKAKEEGYTFAIRYYASNRELWKVMRPEEAKLILASGLSIATVFQNYNNAPGFFNYEEGNSNAKKAHEYAKYFIKQPESTPIYFAVDYDASRSDVESRIYDYFLAIKCVFANADKKYKIGVYGSGAVCRFIKDEKGLADYSWLSMSTGHREHKSYLDGRTWDMHQIKGVKINGISCDSNESNTGGGGCWRF